MATKEQLADIHKFKPKKRGWYNQIEPKTKATIDKLIADFHAGDLGADIDAKTLSRYIKATFSIEKDVDTIGDYVRGAKP